MIFRKSWSVAGLAVLALTLTGCPSQDSDGEDVTNTLKDAGATTQQARCVGEELERELDQDQMNDVAGADKLSELDSSLREIVDATMTECLTGSEASETEGENEADTTDTTAEGEGEGESTTTTAAP